MTGWLNGMGNGIPGRLPIKGFSLSMRRCRVVRHIRGSSGDVSSMTSRHVIRFNAEIGGNLHQPKLKLISKLRLRQREIDCIIEPFFHSLRRQGCCMYEHNAGCITTEEGFYVARNGLTGDSRDVTLDEDCRGPVVKYLLEPLIEIGSEPHSGLELGLHPGNEVRNPSIVGDEKYRYHRIP
ncbi:hypothetical protein GeomeDRAFT_1624 [Geobacter metallireducens RCH3]|nr:hypothetical protein GeomeDRAFT_1624 [Geobacter metallireducens RCH3]